MTKIYRHLIQEVNELIAKGTDWCIEGVNEVTGKGFSIELELTERKIPKIQGISGFRFAQLLWKAGLLPAKNEGQLARKIIKKLSARKQAQVFGLALDTNLLLTRFIPHLFTRRLENLDQKPVIIVPRATCHEFHYKEGYTYRKDSYLYNHLLDFFKKQTFQLKEAVSQLLFHNKNLSYFEKNWQRLPSRNGRLGLYLL